jgi:beta-glucosidase
MDKTVPAILHMWFPGTEGGNAAANLLFGRANPNGKLSMSFPKAVGQCPIYYNHTMTGRPKRNPEHIHAGYTSNYIGCGNLPLYSFGHGLSYSNFIYESLTLSADEMTADGCIRVDITVHNDSDLSGKETVMLYMRDLVGSNARPVQQLIDFQKVEFAAHERKVISFTVTEEMLRFWNNEHKFVSEPGAFELSTGYADHLLHTKRFTLK